MEIDSGSPRRVRVASILVVLGIFLGGALCGAGVDRWMRPHHRGGHGAMLEELGLSAAQREQAHAIRERHRAELDAVMKDTFPKMSAVHERMDEELRPLLTPEQQKKLDELRARRRAEGPPHPRD